MATPESYFVESHSVRSRSQKQQRSLLNGLCSLTHLSLLPFLDFHFSASKDSNSPFS